MKRLLLLGTLIVSPAYALDYCKISTDDDHTRICKYSQMQRYAVSSPVGFPVDLKVDEAEKIKRIEFAYTGLDKDGKPSPTWQGPRTKADGGSLPASKFLNNLPIWPFQEGKSALLLITELTNGSERAYQFELTATAKPDVNTTAALIFTYPEQVDEAAKKDAKEKKAQAVAQWQETQRKQKEVEGIARLKTDVFYGEQNWAYRAKADWKYKFLEPEVGDNGWLTHFRWPANITAPTITVVDPVSNEPQIIPVSKQGELYVVGQTAARFRLYLGKDPVMDIINRHWSAERPDPHTGTTSPEVLRTVTYQNPK